MIYAVNCTDVLWFITKSLCYIWRKNEFNQRTRLHSSWQLHIMTWSSPYIFCGNSYYGCHSLSKTFHIPYIRQSSFQAGFYHGCSVLPMPRIESSPITPPSWIPRYGRIRISYALNVNNLWYSEVPYRQWFDYIGEWVHAKQEAL